MNRRLLKPILPLVVLLVLLLPSNPTQAQRGVSADLEELRAVSILVEELDKAANDEQITKRMLEDQVLVTLRSKAPNLRYDPSVLPALYVSVNLLGNELGYAGSVELSLIRPVEILVGVHRVGQVASKRRFTLAPVWIHSFAIRGPSGEAAAHTRRIIDQLMEAFIADYYRANR